MRLINLLTPLLLGFVILASSCSDDDKGESTPLSTLKWAKNVEQPIIKATWAMEDNSFGNIYPREYLALETYNHKLLLIIPQQYIDNQDHNWIAIREYIVRFRYLNNFDFEIDKKKILPVPAPSIVGGKFRVLAKGKGGYEITAQVNIKHYENGLVDEDEEPRPEVEILNMYFNGTMKLDTTIMKGYWEEPEIELKTP